MNINRCVDIKQSSSGYADGKCFKHICYGYDSDTKQWDGVYIEIAADEQIDCGREEAYTTKDSSHYASDNIIITCPDVDTICGSSSEPFQCKYGNWNDNKEKCMCHVGYTGDQCDEEDRPTTITTASVSSVAATPVYEPGMMDDEPAADSERYSLCLSDMNRWHYYLEGEYVYYQMHNFYPLYRSKFTSNGDYNYILWNIITRKWVIKPVIGGAQYSTICGTDNPWNKDLETCSGNFGNAGTVRYGPCPESVRNRIEIEDDNDMVIENENEVKRDPYYIGEYAGLIIIGSLIIALGCVCIVLIVTYRKRKNAEINKGLMENVKKMMEEEMINEVEIKDENEEQIEETKIDLETEMSVDLR